MRVFCGLLMGWRWGGLRWQGALARGLARLVDWALALVVALALSAAPNWLDGPVWSSAVAAQVPV